MKSCWVIGVIGLAACSGDALPAAAVVVATTPASAAECPNGGSLVRSGPDDNGNGLLDEAEVAVRTVVCSDPPVQPLPTTVVRLTAEPAGARCALGGTAVQSGPDLNGNGVLDDGEVAHVEYVCGELLLTRLASAPPDADCVAGGVAFLAGRDRNHDGRLEDSEVEQRHVACGDELAGNVAVHDEAEVAALAGIAVITGSLLVDGTALRELALPRLLQVRGGIEVKSNADLIRVALPALRSVDGPLALALDPALTVIDLPLLHRVGGLILDGDAALTDLSGLTALGEVTGDVQISNNAALASVDLAIGRIDGGVAIDGNARLPRIAWAMTGRLGAVHIASNAQLTSVELSGTLGGRLTEVGSVTIASNHALDRVALDADVFAAIAIGDSPRLTEVAVTGGRVLGDVALQGDGPARLAFSALGSDAFPIGGSLNVSGPIEAITSARPLVVNLDCRIDRTHLTTFGPDLVSQVGRDLLVSNNSRLTTLSTIPVTQSLEITGNHALTDLEFRPGDELRGTLRIENNASLEAASFEGLKRVIGYVTIASNPALKVFAPSLEEVTGALVIDRNDSLTDLGLTHLWHAGGLAISSCGSLTEIDLPALTLVNIFGTSILGNAQLRHLRFPVLRSGDFQVLSNPVLPACEVTALFSQIRGEHSQRFNDETAVCAP